MRNLFHGHCENSGGQVFNLDPGQNKEAGIIDDQWQEALAQNPDTICVSCPYCMTMFEDGFKDEKAEKVRVKDIAEIVAEGLRPI